MACWDELVPVELGATLPSILFHPSSLVFIIVYTLIAVRNVVKKASLPIWVVMFAGAVSVILLGGIPLREAYQAINLDVVFFLIGMFSIVSALEVSGLLKYITLKILSLTKSPEDALFLVLVGLGTLSAVLMNDTIALMATPIVIDVAREMGVNPVPFLVTLAFAVTIGSSMTPMGNPQNFLIAVESGMDAPLFYFLYYLAPPAILGYLATYLILRWYYRRELGNASRPLKTVVAPENVIVDPWLAKVATIATIVTLAGFTLLSIARLLGYETSLNYGVVALLGAAIVYTLTPRSREVLANVDWSIIIFFMSMFIVMRAVWDSGLVKLLASLMPPPNSGNSLEAIIVIVVASILLSQLMSNVPFVAVYINIMKEAGFGPENTKAWAALAGASTLAGNLTILGAASTIIILEAAEKRGYTFSFQEYFKIGLPVTLASTSALILWLILV